MFHDFCSYSKGTYVNRTYCNIQYGWNEWPCRCDDLNLRGVEHLQGRVNKRVGTMVRLERTTLTLAPKARGGRLLRNFDLTTPDEPCGLVTRLIVGKR